MEFEDIERILELVRQHDLAEFEVESGGMKLRIRKASAAFPMPHAIPPAAAPAPHVQPQLAVPMPSEPEASPSDEESVELAVVKSPIVGTFYRSPEPGAPSFVEIGQRVKKDQVLCIIEAMKLMNEIEAEVAGEVVKVHRESGQPVQYGEPLFSIRPDR